MAFDSREFGERLRKLRTDKGMSQQELADELGIHHGHLSNLERGAVKASIDLLNVLADYFEVSCDYLVRGIDYESFYRKAAYKWVIDQMTQKYESM